MDLTDLKVAAAFIARGFAIQGADGEKIASLLEDLLTPSELEIIAKRLLIMAELSKPKDERGTQEEIARRLKCAQAVVVRARRVLKHGSGVAAETVKELSTKEPTGKHKGNRRGNGPS